MARGRTPKSKKLSEQLQQKLNEIQMDFIREAKDVEEAQKMINIFIEMNEVAKKLDE